MTEEVRWPAKLVRETFLNFFKKHDHAFLPYNDTLLYINDDAVPSKQIICLDMPVQETPAVYTRICIRGGGKLLPNLDYVGKDGGNHTLSEILGTRYYGHNLKGKAIKLAWDLLTEVYKMPSDCIYATFFAGDEEAGLPPDDETKKIWKEFLPDERVLPSRCKDKFLEMAGPCGPCTEILYQRTDIGEAASLVNNNGRIVIWNLVFLQFKRESNDNSLTKLTDWNVITGMEFERLTSVLQEKMSVFDTNVFTPILVAIKEAIGARAYSGKFGHDDEGTTDLAYRVVADHIRTLSFAIADSEGSLPVDYGHESFLRLILHRAVQFGDKFLKAKEGFFKGLVPIMVEEMGDYFPKLKKYKAKIEEKIEEEEDSLWKTYLHWFKNSNELISSGAMHNCITMLSNVIEEECSSPKIKATACCLRAILSQNGNSSSAQLIVKDAKNTLQLLLSSREDTCFSTNIMVLIYNTIDLLSINSAIDFENLHRVIFKLFNPKIEKWVASLWETRRTTHVLCASTVSEAFLDNFSSFKLSEELTSWKICQSVNQTDSVVDVEKAAAELQSMDPNSSRTRYITGYLYHDLCERLASNGQLNKALSYAERAYELRYILFEQKFQQGDGKSHWKLHNHVTMDIWSFEYNDFDLEGFYLSPWRILQCYAESLLQIGVIHELNGNLNPAKDFLERGLYGSPRSSPSLRFAFSSALGNLYLKQQRRGLAENQLSHQRHFFRQFKMLLPCKKCKLTLGATLSAYELHFCDKTQKAEIWNNGQADLDDSEWKQEIDSPRSVFLKNFIDLQWKLVRVRLFLRLLTGLLDSGTDEETYRQNILPRLSIFFNLPEGLMHLPEQMKKMIPGDALALERAELLQNICWWDLMTRSTDSAPALDDETLMSWLMLAFVLSREAPVLFHKVSRMLAAVFSLSSSNEDFSVLCAQYVPQQKWAAYFHQASLGSHSGDSIAPEKVEDLQSYVDRFFESLLSTQVICLSMLGGPYTFLLNKLRNLENDNPLAWILVTRLKSKRRPMVMLWPISEKIIGPDGEVKSYPNEVENLVPEYRKIVSKPLPTFELDRRLKEFLGELQKFWFGPLKYVLLGEWSSSELKSEYENLKQSENVKDLDESDLEVLFGTSSEALAKKEFLNWLYSHGIKRLSVEALKEIKEAILELEIREPIILVMDPELQMLPFESMPILRFQEVYRMPSVRSIKATMDKNIHRQNEDGSTLMIDPHDVFVLLNPWGDTNEICDSFQKYFEKRNLMMKFNFYTGNPLPAPEMLQKRLEDKDLYVFLGHGDGNQYLPVEMVEKDKSCAAACLMGCSSGSLKLNGYYPPKSSPLSYLRAGAPFVICHLWDVFAHDTAKFTQEMLQLWFATEGNKTIAKYVVDARKVVSRAYIAGAAQVCYGVPTGLIKQKQENVVTKNQKTKMKKPLRPSRSR